MITRVGIIKSTCFAKEFTADDELPVCQDFVDDMECALIAEVGPRDKAACLEEDQQEDEGEGVSSKSVQPKLTTFWKSMQSLDDVAAFLDSKGCTPESIQICHTRDVVGALS